MHYKMPINAVSSILNRVTGVALSAGIHLGVCANPVFRKLHLTISNIDLLARHADLHHICQCMQQITILVSLNLHS